MTRQSSVMSNRIARRVLLCVRPISVALARSVGNSATKIGARQEPIIVVIVGTILMAAVTLNMVRIDRRLSEPLQLQLYKQIRRAIISGELPPGARLPSTRDLVEQFGLSRNTIV